MSEYQSDSTEAGDEPAGIFDLIQCASNKLSLEKACRYVDRGIREMWPSATICLDDEDT
jgi:hypothetical protein